MCLPFAFAFHMDCQKEERECGVIITSTSWRQTCSILIGCCRAVVRCNHSNATSPCVAFEFSWTRPLGTTASRGTATVLSVEFLLPNPSASPKLTSLLFLGGSASALAVAVFPGAAGSASGICEFCIECACASTGRQAAPGGGTGGRSDKYACSPTVADEDLLGHSCQHQRKSLHDWAKNRSGWLPKIPLGHDGILKSTVRSN